MTNHLNENIDNHPHHPHHSHNDLIKKIDKSLNNDLKILQQNIITKFRMLEVIKESNSYKKKVIITVISVLFLVLMVMIVSFVNFMNK